MEDLTKGQQNANSKTTSTSVPGSFIFLTIKDEEVYLRDKQHLDTIINYEFDLLHLLIPAIKTKQ